MTEPKSEAADHLRCVLAQFCDDIRYEVGNKVTLVGLYDGALFLQEFPAMIPRLGINLVVDTPIDDQVRSFVLRIEKGDEIIVEATASVPSQPRPDTVVQNGHDELTRAMFSMKILLAPMTVLSPCMLRVKVTLDGVESVAGKLRITAAPSNQTAETS
jgi:hypothetical protein